MMDFTHEIFKASGYVYRCYRTLESFKAVFGFDPRNYPEYFIIWSNSQIVTVTQKFRDICNQKADIVARNWNALGVSTGRSGENG